MRPSILSIALLMLCAAAGAAEPYVDIERRLTPEQRRDTGIDTLSKTQLQLLNRLLREQEHAVEQRTRDEVRAAAPAAPREPYTGLDDAPITARLRGTVTGWEPGIVFELDNGQQWKVLKGSVQLPRPLQAPQVKVEPGLIGRWFLQVDPELPKARVYRID